MSDRCTNCGFDVFRSNRCTACWQYKRRLQELEYERQVVKAHRVEFDPVQKIVIKAVAYGVKSVGVAHLGEVVDRVTEYKAYWIDESLNYGEGAFSEMPTFELIRPPLGVKIDLRGPNEFSISREGLTICDHQWENHQNGFDVWRQCVKCGWHSEVPLKPECK